MRINAALLSLLRERRRLLTLLSTLCLAQFLSSACVSVLAPFFPSEASSRGATAAEVGAVFACFELVALLAGPAAGAAIGAVVSARTAFGAGLLVTSSCCVGFGQLGAVSDRASFVGLSLAVRMVEAVGSAAFRTAAYAMVVSELQDFAASAFSLLEAFLGLGFMVGPILGGVLYQFGGYSAPFLALGLCLMTLAAVSFFSIPPPAASDSAGAGEDKDKESQITYVEILRLPRALFGMLLVSTASASIGLLVTGLEDRISTQFHLTPTTLGLVFAVHPTVYSIVCPLYGLVCDKVLHPFGVGIIGLCFLSACFLLMSPPELILLPPSVPLQVAALVFHGLGCSGTSVASFALIHREAKEYLEKEGKVSQGGGGDEAADEGRRDLDISTQGRVSGLWTSCFSLGLFVGPLSGGASFDAFGFDLTSFGFAVAAVAIATVAAVAVSVQKIVAVLSDRSSNNSKDSTNF